MAKIINKKRLTITIIAILFFLLITFLLIRYHNKSYIDRVLDSKSYSYLSNSAKNYIRRAYEETGELILTEKNKKENTPYLNPDYAEYLDLSDNEKEKLELIPDIYRVDYIPSRRQETATPHSPYSLKEIGHTTPYYDQGDLGLCWTFATIEQIESYLMVKETGQYNENTERFSMRQMDYATAERGIKNYNNENSFARELTEGGNFTMSSTIMSYGLSLTHLDEMPYTDTKEKKGLASVLNFNNSKYEVDSTVVIPRLKDNATEEEREKYFQSGYKIGLVKAKEDFKENYKKEVQNIQNLLLKLIEEK